MLRVVGPNISLVGSVLRSIMVVTNGSQYVRGWNLLLKVVLSLSNGEEMWRRHVAYMTDVDFVAAIDE